ncbi:hypothetical protein ACIQI7_32585 [Kitasatospora sp. NPDC092039]|uniref:hypothetical protein n=1 Tax=Kitasatospora sp. NPDC092039 TaxID=3364086 RepID=UPI0038021EAB
MAAQLAEQEWWTEARVRITAPYTAGAVDPDVTRRFEPGEELVMIQWGRARREVERDSWWTCTDIDAAHIIPAEHVEVLEVLDEQLPVQPTR